MKHRVFSRAVLLVLALLYGAVFGVIPLMLFLYFALFMGYNLVVGMAAAISNIVIGFLMMVSRSMWK